MGREQELQIVNNSDNDDSMQDNQQQQQQQQIQDEEDDFNDIQYQESQGILGLKNKICQYRFRFKRKLQRDPIFKKRFYTGSSILALDIAICLFISIDATCDVETKPVPEQCIDSLLESLPSWFQKIFLCSILIFIVGFCSVTGKSEKKNAIFAFLTAIFLIYIVHGPIDIATVNLRNYKTGIQIALLIMLLIETFITSYIMFVRYLWKKCKILLAVFILFQIYLIASFYHATAVSCNGWEKGLVGEIDYSDEYCEIKIPAICWPVVLDNVLNFSPKTCEIKESQMIDQIIQTLVKYRQIDKEASQEEKEKLAQEVTVFGWPLTNKFSYTRRSKENDIASDIIEEMKVYDTVEQAFQGGSEVAIDVQNMQMHISLQRNETLVEERKEKQEGKDGLAKNVIMIYLDTVSRAHFLRKLPKTAEFLRNYANYDTEEYKENDFKAKLFEYFRFHSIDRRTQDNVFKLRYNIQVDDWQEEKIQLDVDAKLESIFNEIKNAGYIFGHAANSLSIKSNLRQYKYEGIPLYEYFEDDPADHELFLFDPNYVWQDTQFGIDKGANSVKRRCLYGDDTHVYPLEYGKQFLDAYDDEKKFLLLEFTDGHELTSEVIQYMDENLLNFMKNLENKGYMSNDTVIYMLSDHGQHLVSNYQPLQIFYRQENRANDVYTIERMLPFFYAIYTNDILQKHAQLQNIFETNQQRIFGMIQYRNTLLTQVYGLNNTNYNSDFIRSDNLFNPLPLDRTCLQIGLRHLEDPYQYCSCKPHGDYYQAQEAAYKVDLIREQKEKEERLAVIEVNKERVFKERQEQIKQINIEKYYIFLQQCHEQFDGEVFIANDKGDCEEYHGQINGFNPFKTIRYSKKKP